MSQFGDGLGIGECVIMQIERQGRDWVLTAEQWIPHPLEQVFDFFSNAENLEKITPPWLHFRIMTPMPVSMHQGTLIDYRLRMRMIPLRWRTEIHDWNPPFSFVDMQLSGPYRKWVHTHTFEAVDGGTLCKDRVVYRVPLGRIVHELLVRRDLESIFKYRQEAIRRIFSGADSIPVMGTP